MKLVIISDTHDFDGDHITLPPGDLLIHCGDMTGRGTVNQLTKVNKWFGEVKSNYTHGVLFIAGNHDFLFETDRLLAETIFTNAKYLQNSGITLGGFKFWGSPVSPRFFDWAFNRDRGSDIKRYWDLIPEETDVLITHGPPYGIGDRTIRNGNVGCSDLLDTVKKIQPILHCYGHIHLDHGIHKVDDLSTTFINASICTESYWPTNKPIEFELEKS